MGVLSSKGKLRINILEALFILLFSNWRAGTVVGDQCPLRYLGCSQLIQDGCWTKRMVAAKYTVQLSCFVFLNFLFISDGPATVEHIHQHAGVTPDQFIF